MATDTTEEPWRRMRGVVTAVVTNLQSEKFIEDTLDSLCSQIGACSAWSTLETEAGGRLHRSRSVGLGPSPLPLAKHVTEVLNGICTEPRTIAGPLPYANSGSFVAVPLWSHPTEPERGLQGAVYFEFPQDEGTDDVLVDFLDAVGRLLGGAVVQQTVVEEARESLRIERARDRNEHSLRLDELLAPESMTPIRDELLAALKSHASIMLLGESGTGKTHLATAFARASEGEPVVRATLGRADDLNTITSELFGHERGAFSGAVSKRKGLVEYAHGGTLILDEVLNLPSRAQQVLLDFTQFGSYRPLGYEGSAPKRADVRLISVTNGDIVRAIEDQRFREDLYYRLATVPIVLPPLRERREDIPKIALDYLNSGSEARVWQVAEDAISALVSPSLEWRGNIRELEAVMERARNRARVDSSDGVIEARHLDLEHQDVARAGDAQRKAEPTVNDMRKKYQRLSDQKSGLDAIEKYIIEEALAACDGVVLRAARALSVSRSGLVSRITTLKIDPEAFKSDGGS